jgi:hypothetical protein
MFASHSSKPLPPLPLIADEAATAPSVGSFRCFGAFCMRVCPEGIRVFPARPCASFASRACPPAASYIIYVVTFASFLFFASSRAAACPRASRGSLNGRRCRFSGAPLFGALLRRDPPSPLRTLSNLRGLMLLFSFFRFVGSLVALGGGYWVGKVVGGSTPHHFTDLETIFRPPSVSRG